MPAIIKKSNASISGFVALDSSLWIDYALVKGGLVGRVEAYNLFDEIIGTKGATGLICDIVISEFIHVVMGIRIVNECKRMVKGGKIAKPLVEEYKRDMKRFYRDYPKVWQKIVLEIIADEVEPLLTLSVVHYVSYDKLNKEMFEEAKKVITKYDLEPNDAYIIAIMRVLGCDQIASCDNDFKRVDGISLYLP